MRDGSESDAGAASPGVEVSVNKRVITDIKTKRGMTCRFILLDSTKMDALQKGFPTRRHGRLREKIRGFPEKILSQPYLFPSRLRIFVSSWPFFRKAKISVRVSALSIESWPTGQENVPHKDAEPQSKKEAKKKLGALATLREISFLGSGLSGLGAGDWLPDSARDFCPWIFSSMLQVPAIEALN